MEVRRLDCQRNFQMLRSQLDNDIIVETDNTMALHLPVGWLHATSRVDSLGGITAVTAESIRLISSWIQVELESGSDDLQGNLDIYINELEETLYSRKEDVVQDALEGWKQLQSRLRELVDHKATTDKITSEQGKKLIEIWDEFCEQADKQRPCCYDCDLSNSHFHTHFEKHHLSFLSATATRKCVRRG